MPTHCDSSMRRWVELEFRVPGSAEQVWQAVATAEGFSAWFVPVELDGRVGGQIQFDLGGGMTSGGIVTGWEPPVRMVYEEHGWDTDAPPLTTETLITPAGPNECVVRMTHSLFAPDNRWDKTLEMMERGWSSYLDVLRLYAGEHAGEPAAALRWMGKLPGTKSAGWQTLLKALGLTGPSYEEQTQAAQTPFPFAGHVTRVTQTEHSQELALRLTAPGTGALLAGVFTWGEADQAAVSLYLHGADAPAQIKELQPSWQAWLEGLFPPGE